MKQLFSVDGPIVTALGKTVDFMNFSILWLVCCVPVITAGAATASLRNLAPTACSCISPKCPMNRRRHCSAMRKKTGAMSRAAFLSKQTVLT